MFNLNTIDALLRMCVNAILDQESSFFGVVAGSSKYLCGFGILGIKV